MDEQDEPRQPSIPPWTTGSPADPAAEPDADGPPPPPWVRRRRRRRRILGIVAVVALLVAVPLGLVATGVLDRPDGETVADEHAEGDGEASRGTPAPDATLDAPEPDRFEGSDADLAAVLRDIEASERVMLRFQADLAEAYRLAGADDLTPFLAAVRSAADSGAGQLAEARSDLDTPVETAAADEIRAVYLDHLDAWLDLMEATADDPTLFGPAGDTGRFDVAINATALDFARAVESGIPDDAADEIERFAQDLLDRGFRFDGEAEV